jgi:TonB family protein
VLVPPRLVRDEGARYPEQALREKLFQHVTVVLVLELDARGAVTRVDVEAPAGHGFDEAAAEAARRLQFEPATRNGVAVASRIRFQYSFAPPPPRLQGTVTSTAGRPLGGAIVIVRTADGATSRTTSEPDGSWSFTGNASGPVHVEATAAGHQRVGADAQLVPGEIAQVVLRLPPAPLPPPADAAPDAGAPVEEVVVHGPPPVREVTRRTMTSDEIAHIPGTRGDALASVQAMPGIGHSPAFSGQIIVRGSAPEDTNVFVDGTGVPLVYHFGGLSSVVPTELLDRLDLFPGNFSAQYGRGMGGVVDVALRDPQKDDRFHAMAQVDLIDARLIVEGPIADGWRFLAAGRRSWFDVWLGPILSKGGGPSVAPVYYDYQAMVQKDFDAHQSFRLLFFGSDDQLELFNGSGANPTFAGDLGDHTSFWRAQARYVNRFSRATELRATAAVGQDSIDIGLGSNYVKVDTTPITSRVELSEHFAPAVTMNVGMDLFFAA